MNFKLLIYLAITSGLMSSQVQAASPTVNTSAHVGSYNLIIKNDLTLNSHVDGKGLIGGDLNSSNTSNTAEFGSKITDPDVDSVTVLGNVNGTLKAQSGTNIVYGTNSGSLQLNGGGDASQITDATTAQNDFNSIWDQVVADSQTFKGLTATGTFNTDDNNSMKFKNDNSLDLNIFNITANALSSNGGFSLDFTSTAPIVINVSGTGTINLTSQASGNFANPSNASNVLWNFYEATTINFANGSWWGSVLAPQAELYVTNGNNLEGGIAALSLDTNKEVHSALYSYSPPSPPTNTTSEVPAPAGSLIMALGLVFMGYRKFKK